MYCGCRFRHDPGPCPVDDTPHTACTPESIGSTLVSGTRPVQSLTVPLKRPGWLPPAPAAAQQTVETFTTATYRKRKRRV